MRSPAVEECMNVRKVDLFTTEMQSFVWLFNCFRSFFNAHRMVFMVFRLSLASYSAHSFGCAANRMEFNLIFVYRSVAMPLCEATHYGNR